MQATQNAENQGEKTAQDEQLVLPDDLTECHLLIAAMKELLLEKDSLLQKRESDLERIKQHLHNLLRHRYGQSSEKLTPGQLQLFAEEMLNTLSSASSNDPADQELEAPKQNKSGNRTKHGGGGRNPLPEELPLVEKDYFPEDTHCPGCAGKLEEFGLEITEQLDYVPANFRKIRHIVHKFSCPSCRDVIAEGKKPEQIHSGGMPTEGLLAQIITAKWVDHSPLERQTKTYDRQGVTIAVSTMGRWMRLSAEKLRPIVKKMAKLVLLSRMLEVDESPLDFIDLSRALKKIKKGYFWAIRGDDDFPYNIFEFHPDRGSEHPKKFLSGFDGFLLTDGYGGYIWYNPEKSLNCNIHCRRYFEKAAKANKKQAGFALAVYMKLYEIEDRIRKLPEDERLRIRKEESVPILEKFHAWLQEKQRTEPPKTLLGVAVNYALERWDKLIRYTKHGFLKMDTNLVENSIRPHALTRKNAMFAGSEDGGETAAIHSTIVNTCKRLGINPFEYIKDVLTKMGANPKIDIDELLPDRWKAAQPP